MCQRSRVGSPRSLWKKQIGPRHCPSLIIGILLRGLNVDGHVLKTKCSKHKTCLCMIKCECKKNLFFGNFSQLRTPSPLPLLGISKFFYRFFCQVGNFWVILRCVNGFFRAMVYKQQVLGIGMTPPPLLGKFPNNTVFLNSA